MLSGASSGSLLAEAHGDFIRTHASRVLYCLQMSLFVGRKLVSYSLGNDSGGVESDVSAIESFFRQAMSIR